MYWLLTLVSLFSRPKPCRSHPPPNRVLCERARRGGGVGGGRGSRGKPPLGMCCTLGTESSKIVAANVAFLGVMWVGASGAGQCTDAGTVKDRKYACCKSAQVHGSCAAHRTSTANGGDRNSCGKERTSTSCHFHLPLLFSCYYAV